MVGVSDMKKKNKIHAVDMHKLEFDMFKPDKRTHNSLPLKILY